MKTDSKQGITVQIRLQGYGKIKRQLNDIERQADRIVHKIDKIKRMELPPQNISINHLYLNGYSDVKKLSRDMYEIQKRYGYERGENTEK